MKYINNARLWTARGNRAARFAGSYKSFTRHNFRHNLKVRTGLAPGPKMHAHHVFTKELASDFAAKGINVHDPKFGAWWLENSHLSAHRRGYNGRWKDFFETKSNAGAQEVEVFGRRLAREYGLEIGF